MSFRNFPNPAALSNQRRRGDFAWLGDRQVFVPDVEITEDRPEYNLSVTRGSPHSLIVFDERDRIIGWMPVEVTGFGHVREWLEHYDPYDPEEPDKIAKFSPNPSAPTVNRWHTPPENQGQFIEVSYGVDEDGIPWRREIDWSDRSVEYEMLDDYVLEDWQPWNRSPE